MRCYSNGTLTICVPHGITFRAYWTCPTQKLKCRVVIWDEPWYGCKWYCCGCGEEWDSEGVRKRLKPEKRAAAIARHRQMWKEAKSRKEANDWLRAEIFFGEEENVA